MANMNTQVTTQASLSPTMQTFYDKRLLDWMKDNLVHTQFGQKRPIPKNSGKTVQFRKFGTLPAITTPLVEGVVPDGQSLTITELMATVAQYGGYVTLSDLLDLTALDSVIDEALRILGYQGALSLDTITRTEMNTTTNIVYANGKTSRALLAAGDKLTTLEIRKAVAILKKNSVPTINGSYVAIVNPSSTFDLQGDPLWQQVSTYAKPDQIYNGEIGRLFGVRFVETNQALTFNTNAVNGTLVFGADAYGLIDIAGSGTVKTIIKPRGSAGTADPIDQMSTVAWKVMAFVAKLLQPTRILRIESYATV